MRIHRGEGEGYYLAAYFVLLLFSLGALMVQGIWLLVAALCSGSAILGCFLCINHGKHAKNLKEMSAET